MIAHALCIAMLMVAGTKSTETADFGWPTLREAIRRAGVHDANPPTANLDQKITSFANTHGGSKFAIAYWLNAGEKSLGSRMWLAELDRPSNSWLAGHVDFDREPERFFGGQGSVMRVEFIGKYLYVETHNSPAASTTLQFTRKLRLRSTYFGWRLAEIADGNVVYLRSMTTESPETDSLAVFDAVAGTSRSLFPTMTRGAIRTAFDSKYREFFARVGSNCYDGRYFSLDPARADRNVLLQQVRVNSRTDSLAFVVHYGCGGETGCPRGLPSYWAAYVYCHLGDSGRMRWREVPANEGFSSMTVSELDARLDALTSEPAIARMFGS
ncbi:MAG TPA: hypothetical protein VJN22_04695 [Candidatus Eremiobacteraceae bacterium]|nr:hypothetical protein [Candidatus Eremiobacteraceae bacterium]